MSRARFNRRSGQPAREGLAPLLTSRFSSCLTCASSCPAAPPNDTMQSPPSMRMSRTCGAQRGACPVLVSVMQDHPGAAQLCRPGQHGMPLQQLTISCLSPPYLVGKVLLPQRDDAAPSGLPRAQVGSDESQGEPTLARGGMNVKQVGSRVKRGVDERRKQLKGVGGRMV